MKYLLPFFIFSSVYAATGKPLTIDKVQSISADKEEVMVTLWSTNRVFRMSKTNHVVPCLENAFKAKQDVALDINNEAGLILDCKMAGTEQPLKAKKIQK